MDDNDQQRQPQRPAQQHFNAALAVALNLIPVIGVLVWGWSAFALVLLYWLENVAVGVRTAAQIMANGLVADRSQLAPALSVAAFFVVHYGMFCFVHGVFVITMFAGDAYADDPANLPAAVLTAFGQHPGLQWGLASVVVWQAVGFMRSLTRGGAKHARPMMLMIEPYPRVIIMHFTILLGGAVVMVLNEPLIGVVALAVVKAAFDVADALGMIPLAALRRRLELPR